MVGFRLMTMCKLNSFDNALPVLRHSGSNMSMTS